MNIIKNIIFVIFLTWSLVSHAAIGEVELVGIPITSSHSSISNVFDGDLKTFWSDYPNNWVGIDLGEGKSATITGWSFSASPSEYGYYTREILMQNAFVQSDVSPQFNSPITLDIVPEFPYYPRYKLNTRYVSGSGRAFRVMFFYNFAAIAELKFYAIANTTANSRPIEPIISPWGGRFSNSNATVSITSKTTSAQIYYTTNGISPTTNDILYTSPINLNFTNTIEIRAIAIDQTLNTPNSSISEKAFFSPWGFMAAQDLYDNTGVLTEAHSGDIFDNRSIDGYYYWQGNSLNFADSGVDLPPNGYTGIWIYKSVDLKNWEYVDNILPDLGMSVTRTHIIRNPNGLLVMWGHNTRNQVACVATSTLPIGPWNWYSTNTVPIGGVKDCNLFKDTDNKAYFIHSDTNQVSGNGKMRITLLSDDYLSPTTSQGFVRINSSDEAPVLFKNNGIYYTIFSCGNYYNNLLSYNERWIKSSVVLTDWTTNTVNQLWESDPLGDIYNGQPSFVVKYNGGLILGRDQWHNNQSEPLLGLYDSRQVWVPLSFDLDGNILPLKSNLPITWDISRIPSRIISGKRIITK
jgi:hypothetical protein